MEKLKPRISYLILRKDVKVKPSCDRVAQVKKRGEKKCRRSTVECKAFDEELIRDTTG